MSARVESHHVILVHGTFGRGLLPRKDAVASWCAPDGIFRRTVAQVFGDDATFHVFTWSGRNSPAARLEAADQLTDYIRTLRTSTDSPIHIVAHSHAGNIVLYAARNEEIAKQISSVMCLSTPFLHITPRVLGSTLALKLEVTAGLAAMSLVVVTSTRIWPALTSELYRLIRTGSWSDYLLGIVPIGIIAGLLAVGFMRLFRTAHTVNHGYATQLELPRRLPCPVLILRAPGDEALGLLGGVQLLSGLITRLLAVTARPVPADPPVPRGTPTKQRWHALRFSVRAGALLVGIGIVLLPALLLMKAIGAPPSRAVVDWVSTASLILMMGGGFSMLWGTLVTFLMIPIVAALGLMLGALAAFFGMRFAVAAISLRISAEATPPGEWCVTQLDAGDGSLEDLSGLNHSTHSNPRAMAAVREFLVRHFGSEPK